MLQSDVGINTAQRERRVTQRTSAKKKHPLGIFAVSKLVDKTSHTFTQTHTHNYLSKSFHNYISEDRKTITNQVKRCVLVQMVVFKRIQ